MAVAIRANHQADAGDEQELVAAVREGRDAAFGILYERYRLRIGAYIGSMVADRGRAEDITQDVFISALRRLRATDQAVIFKPWLYEIAKNACIDEYRRSRRNHEVPLDAGPDSGEIGKLPSPAPSPPAAFESKMRLDDLRGAFRGLSDNHHRILVLRELEGLSYNQIGDRMGLSKPVVESTLFRARRRLGEEFAELESGRRCAHVQGLIECVADGRRASTALGLRERRLLSRHISHCAPCGRRARLAGIDVLEAPKRKPSRLAIPALLPISWLRWRRSAHSGLANAHATTAAQAVQSLAPTVATASPFSGFGRAIAAAVIAVAGAGGGLVATGSIGTTRTAPARIGHPSHHAGFSSAGGLGAGGAAAGAGRDSSTGATAIAAGGAARSRNPVALLDRIVTLVPLTLGDRGTSSGWPLSPLTGALTANGGELLGGAPNQTAVGWGAGAGGAPRATVLGWGGSLLSDLFALLRTPIPSVGPPAGSPITSNSPVLRLGGTVSRLTTPVMARGATEPPIATRRSGRLGTASRREIGGLAGAASSATATATGAIDGSSSGAGGPRDSDSSAGSPADRSASKASSSTPVRSTIGVAAAAAAPVAASTAGVVSSVSTAANAATSAVGGAVSSGGGTASSLTGAASTAGHALSHGS